MKKIVNRLLGSLLAAAMLIGLLPLSAMPVFAADPPGINVSRAVSGSDSGSGWSWTTSGYNGTLTLNSYSGGPIAIGGSSQGSLDIILNGANSVTTSSPYGGSGNSCIGIRILNANAVTFRGGGSLTVNINSGEGLKNVYGIEMTKSGTAISGSSLSFSGCRVDINVTNTGAPDNAEVFGIRTRDMTDSGGVTIASDAELNINLSSNTIYSTKAIYSYGNITLNGKLLVKQVYTGTAGLQNHWRGVENYIGSNNSIGAGASVSIGMPNGSSPGTGAFKLAANGNTTVDATSFSVSAEGYSDFENSVCRMVQSDAYGPLYSDFDYMTKAGAVAVTGVTASVSDDELSAGDTALAGADVQPSSASYKGVVWVSSNNSLAAVDSDGNVTAGSGNGKAVIKAISKFDPSIRGSVAVTVGTLDPLKIYDVSASVPVPFAGDPVNSVSITVPGAFSVDSAAWQYWDGSAWQNAGASFEADKIYRVSVGIKENDASKTYAEADSMAAVINGHAVAVSSIYGSGSDIASTDYYIMGKPAAALPKEATPNAVFSAENADSGTLSGLVAGGSYTVSGAVSGSFTASGSTYALTGVSAGILSLVKKGDGVSSSDSIPQTITVTKASAPTGVAAVDCTGPSNDDGRITGVAAGMEYKGLGSWADISGSELTGLVPGSYDVRVKAAGSALASDTVSVTVGAYSAAALTGTVSISGSAVNGSTLTANVSGSNNSGTLSYQWKRDGADISGAAGSSYTLVTADVGHVISVSVTSSVETGSITSAATAAVSRADVSVTGVSCTTSPVYESTALSSIVLAGTKAPDVPGTLALDAGQTLSVGTNNYNWTFTPTDSAGYNGTAGTVSITVSADVLTGISASGTPSKTVYEWGEAFETAGLSVTASYASGVTNDVTSLVTAGELEVGDSSVTLSYGGKSCTVGGITVNKKTVDISGVSWDVSGSPFIYDGTEKSVALTGVPAGVNAAQTGDKATNAGTYTASATLTPGDSAHYQLSSSAPVTAAWTINKAAPAVTVDPISVTYSGSPVPASAITGSASFGGSPVSGSFSWKGSPAVTNVSDSGSKTVTFTPSDNTNYNSVDASLTLTISRADVSVTGVSCTTSPVYESTALSSIILAGTKAPDVPGTLTLDAGQTLSVGTNNYNWTFIPADSANYNSAQGTVSITVSADVLTGISASGTPSKTVYEWGEAFETAGLSVTASYASGVTGDVTSQVTAGELEVGDSSVTLSYGGKSCTVGGITVNKKTVDISGVSWDTGGSPFTYDGTEKSVALTGVPAGVNAAKTGDKATNAGTYTASAALTPGDSAHYQLSSSAPVTAAWTINKAATAGSDFSRAIKAGNTLIQNVSAADFGLAPSAGSFALSGSISDASGALDGSPGYGASVSFKLNSSAAGGSTVSIPLSFTPADTNYAVKNVTLTINVTSKDTPVVTVNPISVTYSGSPVPASAITGSASFGGNPVPGSFSWKGSPAITNVSDSGSKTATFTPSDSASYESVDVTLTLTISKADCTGAPAYTAISASGKTLADAAIALGTLAPAGGIVSWNDPAATAVAQGASYGWTYIPADTANYNSRTGSVILWPAYFGGYTAPSYAVGVQSAQHGSVSVSPRHAESGQTVTVSVAPDEGYELDELSVTGAEGKEIKLTEQDGKFSFVMPAGRVNVSASFAAEGTVLPFTDVSADDWFYEPVKWAVRNSITTGTSATTFSPDAPCTRAQMVSFIWRAAGMPEPVSAVDPFIDVDESSYYYKALLWAYEQGIAKGTSAEHFSPELICTRAQIVAMLHRFARSPAANIANPFGDVASDAYYNIAVSWSAENGITAGTGPNTFSPGADCTRAQIVTFLYRYMTK